MRPAVLAAVLVACGGGAQPVAPPRIEPPAPPEAACPPVAEITLADGKLRCRELPVVIDFPANTTLKRVDDGNFTFFNATLDRGVLAVFIEPRFDIEDDAAGIRARLETVAKEIAPDAKMTELAAPPQRDAKLSAAISFTTEDGGAGVAHGYIAHNWFVGVFAGGRKLDTASRPDQPVGKAFLASLKLRPVSTKWLARDLFGLQLELPEAAWESTPVKGDESAERAVKLWSVAHERVWIGARDLDPSPKCALFDGVTDADVPALVRKMFGRDDLEVTGKLVAVATRAMYAELATPGGTMVMYLACRDPAVVLVTVTGKRPPEELRGLLDRVTSSFAR